MRTITVSRVPAHPDILVRIVSGAPLTHDDVAGFNDLTAKFLDAEPFGM